MIRADFIVLNNKETSITNQQRELLDLSIIGKFGWDKVCELGLGVLAGHHPGRTASNKLFITKVIPVSAVIRRRRALSMRKCRGVRRRGLPSRWFGARPERMDGEGGMPSP